jgi:hypothetical protein
MQKKKRVIIHISNLPPEAEEALKEKYPEGYKNHIRKYPKPNGEFFHAVELDCGDASYLVKVDVKIDNITEDKLDDAIFSGIGGGKPSEKIEEEDDADDEPEEEDKDTPKTDPGAKEDDLF